MGLVVMNILLVKPWAKLPTYFPPLGLAYLGASLEKAGHSVKILDLTVESIDRNDFNSLLQKYKPDAVGIGCMATEFNDALEVASICKEVMPWLPVIVGGPLPTSIPHAFLEQPTIDIAVLGEGEATIVELLEVLQTGRSLEGVQGIAYKEDGKLRFNSPRSPILDLDSLPFPARHLLPIEKYFSPFENWLAKGSDVRATTMISSRGCPYKCIFCDKNVFGAKWRGRSAANIVDEIELLARDYGINGLLFSDDMFDFSRKRVYQICDEITSRGLDVVWGVNSRVNHADEEMYKRMKQSGCRYVGFGIESGNQDILDFMCKNISLTQVRDAVNIANGVGLRTMGYFMIGMMGDNKETIKQTIEFAKGLDLDSGGFSKVTPLPGTVLFQLAKEQGFIGNEDSATSDQFGSAVSLTRDLDSEQLDKIVERAYWQFFWSRPSRRLPKPICSTLSASFPIVWSLTGGRMDFFIRLNRVRELLHLPLP